jgi:serine/threonine protein kinase
MSRLERQAPVPISTCPSEDLVSAFYDGALPFEKHLEVARHFKECLACRVQISKSGRPVPVATDPNAGSTIEMPSPDPSLDRSPVDANHFPTRVGPYRIKRLIGRGGMGNVYEAVHEMLDRPVALKLLMGPSALDHQFLARFRREALAIGRLNHPNVVRPMDAGISDGYRFLAMELLSGTDLGRIVRLLGCIPVPDAAEIIRQAAEALAHAHSKGMVHRDVKPSNLMLTSEGVVKLLDLGLALTIEARQTGAEARLTGTSFLGTHDFMAPEQWNDSSSVQSPADTYSLGCVFYNLLTGRAPFAASGNRGNSPQAKMKAHLDAPPPDPRQVLPELAPALAELILAMMDKKPENRPSAERVAKLLKPQTRGCSLTNLVARCTNGPQIEFPEQAPTHPAVSILPSAVTRTIPQTTVTAPEDESSLPQGPAVASGDNSSIATIPVMPALTDAPRSTFKKCWPWVILLIGMLAIAVGVAIHYRNQGQTQATLQEITPSPCSKKPLLTTETPR